MEQSDHFHFSFNSPQWLHIHGTHGSSFTANSAVSWGMASCWCLNEECAVLQCCGSVVSPWLCRFGEEAVSPERALLSVSQRTPATPGDSELLSSTSEPLHLAQESHVCVTCATQKGLDIALQPKHSYAPLLISVSAWVLFSHKPERQNFPWRQALRRISMQPCHEQKRFPQAPYLYFLP
jgi:hypothetical protein